MKTIKTQLAYAARCSHSLMQRMMLSIIYTHPGNENLRRAAEDLHGVLTHKDKKVKASAKADEGKVVPWAGKFGMKQA